MPGDPSVVALVQPGHAELPADHHGACSTWRAIARIDQPAFSPVEISTRFATVNPPLRHQAP